MITDSRELYMWIARDQRCLLGVSRFILWITYLWFKLLKGYFLEGTMLRPT